MAVSRAKLINSAFMLGLLFAQPLYVCASAENDKDLALTKLEPKLDLGDKDKAVKTPAVAPTGAPQVTPVGDSSIPRVIDNYPTISQMETITFGAAKPDVAIEDRLSALEQSVFKSESKGLSLFDRTERLKVAVLGATDESTGNYSDLSSSRNLNFPGLAGLTENNGPEASFLDGIAQTPENQKVVDKEEVCRYALDVVNIVRSQMALDPLVPDPIADRMAKEHIQDLVARNVVSHNNRAGENPDYRYTALGGTDAVSESLITLKNPQLGERKPTKALAVQMLKAMMSKEDDREAMLSPDSTGFGFSLDWLGKKAGVLACCEFSTKHGIIQPIQTPIRMGEKIEVKGLVSQPYKLDRITLAWEGINKDAPLPEDEGDEALPYFPPLDYVAYASKSEHDYEKAAATLRTVGIVAAIAGGIFIPPVALAAPLIACSGGMSEPKPMSDIPVHGGVKVEGLTFVGKLAIRNSGKNGLYYITVWASSGKNSKSIPISRRAYVVNLPSTQESPGEKNDDSTRKLEVEAVEQHKS